ncbi:MAG: hypothetical protein HYW26_04120 [Candidatus Aenigmarchaeota archaeon]|nr:hypothetical protein [Candidatus Aenigmarchaeota archaeon]
MKLALEFRKRIPFLRLIPDKVYFDLNFDEFFLPDDEINELRKSLESMLNHYVMTYKTNGFDDKMPKEKHLCFNLEIAELNVRQMKILSDFESIAKRKGVSFCVYRKPLKLVPQIDLKAFPRY